MISIVIAQHNRRQQLINTLNSIDFWRFAPIEVIIVDDTDITTESIDDLPDKYQFPVHIIKIRHKSWSASLVSFNIGFDKVSGGTIIIQNPECMHVGNVLKYTQEHSKTGVYLSFAAYSLDYSLGNVNFKEEKDALRKLVVSAEHTFLKGHSGWYNHSFFRPVGYHFCTAISRTDLERLNGFDERYKDGIANDDAEILVRIDNAGIERVIIDDPFVIHQYHARTNAKRGDPHWQKNYKLYLHNTLVESFVKAPKNTYYVR